MVECYAQLGGGITLGCNKSYHLTCVHLKDYPTDFWICHTCKNGLLALGTVSVPNARDSWGCKFPLLDPHPDPTTTKKRQAAPNRHDSKLAPRKKKATTKRKNPTALPKTERKKPADAQRREQLSCKFLSQNGSTFFFLCDDDNLAPNQVRLFWTSSLARSSPGSQIKTAQRCPTRTASSLMRESHDSMLIMRRCTCFGNPSSK